MERDPGLQPERTALAWQRTGIAGSALAGTVTVAAAHLASRRVLMVLIGLAGLCAVAGVVGVVGARSARFKPFKGSRGSPWTRLLAVAAIPVLLAVAGALLALS